MTGTYKCPICGKGTPHEHTGEEIVTHRIAIKRTTDAIDRLADIRDLIADDAHANAFPNVAQYRERLVKVINESIEQVEVRASTPAPVAIAEATIDPAHPKTVQWLKVLAEIPMGSTLYLAAPPTRPDVGDARDAEVARLNAIINTPHADDFIRAVSIEAEHQRQRWGAEGDAGKTPADWFWLVGYLAGKALHSHAAGTVEKGEHHIITTAAACANWHRALFGKTDMRPGHEEGLGALLAPQSSEKEVGEAKGGEKGDD